MRSADSSKVSQRFTRAGAGVRLEEHCHFLLADRMMASATAPALLRHAAPVP